MASASPTPAANCDQAVRSATGSVSPHQVASPKKVTFELLFTETQVRGRLPMRVDIFPHDSTDSIVTTVKNFYGLYSGPTGSRGVSFEDQDGTTLIARYENFRNCMTVYVRVIEDAPAASSNSFIPPAFNSAPNHTQPFYGTEAYPLQAPPHFTSEFTRTASRSPRRRSPSPYGGHDRRSASANANPRTTKKSRSRSSRARDPAAHPHAELYSDSINGYSSGDGAPGSTTSGKAKEQLGNTEISLENIVEGGRRKRAKFESSELPLFAPPQMPAATSNPSVSPARRIEHQRPSISHAQQGQNPFTNPMPLQSPQSYNNGFGQAAFYATPASDTRRARNSISHSGQGSAHAGMSGILPTPDPTVGSCMSEEDKDVAIQLMRLGDMSNISHGRTSASTLDDTFSGRADAASSTGATSEGDSDSEEELPEARRQKLDAAGTMRKIYQTTESHFMPPNGGLDRGATLGEDAATRPTQEDEPPMKPLKSKTALPDMPRPKVLTSAVKTSKTSKASKVPRPVGTTKSKKPAASVASNGPMSPSSLPPSRKPSVTAGVPLPPGTVDEEQLDLSAKPRCQRCRKSKKGCDRQRPCGRCKDAGLSADQCISEDEGNGRKGRYGRHMGVPIKMEDIAVGPSHPSLMPSATPVSAATTAAAAAADKLKKRKR
ncbi:hypothetical protein VDGD_08332 [Verticillium dahliae]|nr:hypothetical protein VdG1_03842 [Verticillium dahliae VDG1]RBQ72474.1 hypothetical protein VDGD_08332 [Verticillium dahliae]